MNLLSIRYGDNPVAVSLLSTCRKQIEKIEQQDQVTQRNRRAELRNHIADLLENALLQEQITDTETDITSLMMSITKLGNQKHALWLYMVQTVATQQNVQQYLEREIPPPADPAALNKHNQNLAVASTLVTATIEPQILMD